MLATWLRSLDFSVDSTDVEDDAKDELDNATDNTGAEDDAVQQPNLDYVSTFPAVNPPNPSYPAIFPRIRTQQQAKLRWAKPLVSTIMPNASRVHVQQLNELLHAIRTPDGLQRVYQAMKGRQQEQECSKICNALKTTLTQGNTEDTKRKQHTVAQLIKRGRHHQKLVHAYYLFIMYHTCNQSLFLFNYRKQ